MSENFVRLCAFSDDPLVIRLCAELEAAEIPHMVRPSRSKVDNLHSGFRQNLGLSGLQEIAVPQESLAAAKVLASNLVSEMAERYAPVEYACPKCEGQVGDVSQIPNPGFVGRLVNHLRALLRVERWQCENCGHVLTEREMNEQRLAWDEDDPMFEGVDFDDAPKDH